MAYYALGLLPGVFAIPAGLGDIVAGSTALLMVIYIGRITLRRKIVYAAWTLYGMGDLFDAMILGTISSAAFTQTFHILPTSNPAISQLPIGLIPTFGVPLLMILEVLALLKIRRLPRP